VVKNFFDGNGGAKLLAQQWSVPEEKIRTWVSHYRLHGIDGLKPKRSKYSTQFNLQVLSQDREQLPNRQVAAVYDIRNPNQVVVWRRNLDRSRRCRLSRIDGRSALGYEERVTLPRTAKYGRPQTQSHRQVIEHCSGPM